EINSSDDVSKFEFLPRVHRPSFHLHSTVDHLDGLIYPNKDSSYSNSCNTGKADMWNSQVMWISTIALSIQSETSVPRRHSFLRVVLLTGPQAKS
ncbi:hypothetical protein T4B_7389, partial [Trichinella pseudospiralis]